MTRVYVQNSPKCDILLLIPYRQLALCHIGIDTKMAMPHYLGKVYLAQKDSAIFSGVTTFNAKLNR